MTYDHNIYNKNEIKRLQKNKFNFSYKVINKLKLSYEGKVDNLDTSRFFGNKDAKKIKIISDPGK